jgi:flagellar basal body-associated protein FliL
MADVEGGKGRGVGKDRDEKAESATPAPAKGPSQLKLVIFGAVALFVALVGAQVAAPLINATITGSHAEDAEGEELLAEAEEEEIIEEEPVDEEEPVEEEPIAPAIYTALDPPFVVSFDAEDGARYLQLTLQAMARDEETIAAVKQHAPAIRNSVLFMLSGYELEVLATQAGKEELRKSLLGATNEILAKNGVESPVEELFFTSLVIQ